MSPAAKTPGTLVIQVRSRQTFPRSVSLTPRSLSSPSRLGPRKPMARSTRSASMEYSVPGTFLNVMRPLSTTISTLRGVERRHAAVRTGEVGRVDGEFAHAALFVGRSGAEDIRPERPWVPVGVPLVWGSRQDLELGHRARALAVDGAETIGAGIAAADDHDVLVVRRDEVAVRDCVALGAPVLERQIVHREVDAGELTPGDLEVARPLRAPRQYERVEVLSDRLDRQGRAHIDAVLEGDPGGLHEPEAAVEDALLHLELRDTVAQEPADPVGLL